MTIISRKLLARLADRAGYTLVPKGDAPTVTTIVVQSLDPKGAVAAIEDAAKRGLFRFPRR